jgi:CRISPR-associated protein Cas2
MFVIVCYDVNTDDLAGRRRLRRMAKKCESYGQRVQKSVFECLIEPEDYLLFENALRTIMDKESDSLCIYELDESSRRKIRRFGKNKVLDFERPLVI